MTGVQVASGCSVTLVVRGSNKLVLEKQRSQLMCYQMFSKEKVNTLSSMCVRVGNDFWRRCSRNRNVTPTSRICEDINWNGVIKIICYGKKLI